MFGEYFGPWVCKHKEEKTDVKFFDLIQVAELFFMGDLHIILSLSYQWSACWVFIHENTNDLSFLPFDFEQ